MGRKSTHSSALLLIFSRFFTPRFVIMDMNEDKFLRHISQWNRNKMFSLAGFHSPIHPASGSVEIPHNL
jgi:hypothetical protein